MTVKTQDIEFIAPLFTLSDMSSDMGRVILEFTNDDYNKKLGSALIDANNDAEAIATFLNEYKDSVDTLRSYSKEIERLLLWCIYVGKVNISSLRRNHFVDYQEFLKSPTPKKQWCGPAISRITKDGEINKNWRPFVSGLGSGSINKALTILDSFFNYLVQTNYLTGNPLAVDKRRKKRNKSKPQIIDRYLELDKIHAVLDALSNHNINDEQQKFQVLRARYIILLLFFTGLRIAEAANHRMGNFIQREGNWFLRVTGKGKKIREVPIPDDLLDILAKFRIEIGPLSPMPKFREKTPLIPMQNLTQSITTRRIDQIIRWAFNLGANTLETDEPRKASKLRAASAHWLRHGYVTYLLDSGASLKVAQENAGHSNVGTTMHYRHVAQTDRHEATRSLSLTKSESKKSKDG
ncbi:MAG: site-specific integrase [Gammaproteobacteria bacterium]|nr:site-specific integrase [Gammaproteobacteria bacterium]